MSTRPTKSIALALVAALAACVPPHGNPKVALPPAPLLNADASVYEALPADEQQAPATVLYVTDREPLASGPTPYGFGRSQHIRFGEATVTPPTGRSWADMTERSTYPARKSWRLARTSTTELGTVEPVTALIDASAAALVWNDEAEAKMAEDLAPLVEVIGQRARPTGDVYVYVHGFASGFDTNVTRLAGVWHMMGRHGVPIAFSWPSGMGGYIPTAYQHDRESGEFAVPDLRVLLEVLADTPHVERVHLVAHSRGTDVLATTLRELLLEEDGDRERLQARYKLDTVVYAAPDIDADVFVRRVLTTGTLHMARRVLLYVSGRDASLKASAWMQGSALRIGRLALDAFNRVAENDSNAVLQVIVVDKPLRGDTHGYFASDPAVLSDMILAIRDHFDPGPQRPLKATGQGVWVLDETYLTSVSPGETHK